MQYTIKDTIADTYDDWYLHPEYNFGDNAAFREHMPTLRMLAREKHVVEFGCRWGTSTLAILAGSPSTFDTIDIEIRPSIVQLWNLARHDVPLTTFNYYQTSSIEFEIEDGCDLLFIDTLHTGNLLYEELTLHCNNVRERIVMHDLVSFGHKNEDGNEEGLVGLVPAMNKFLAEHPEWEIDTYYHNCNGLMIFHRVGVV